MGGSRSDITPPLIQANCAGAGTSFREVREVLSVSSRPQTKLRAQDHDGEVRAGWRQSSMRSAAACGAYPPAAASRVEHGFVHVDQRLASGENSSVLRWVRFADAGGAGAASGARCAMPSRLRAAASLSGAVVGYRQRHGSGHRNRPFSRGGPPSRCRLEQGCAQRLDAFSRHVAAHQCCDRRPRRQ